MPLRPRTRTRRTRRGASSTGSRTPARRRPAAPPRPRRPAPRSPPPRPPPDPRRRSVLRGDEELGERFERAHELIELVGIEALVRLRGEVVGERLDPLLDGAALVAQPTVVADQAAVAHPVDH